MLKRMFRYNRFFSLLFMISFTASFIIIYYGLDINRKFDDVMAVRRQSVYAYKLGIHGELKDSSAGVPKWDYDKGNIIRRTTFNIGEGAVDNDAVDIIWAQNEELREPYRMISDLDSGKPGGCLIGDGLTKRVFDKDGAKYIKLEGVDIKVLGYLLSETFDGEDRRCILFWEGLSDDDKAKLLLLLDYQHYEYVSNTSDMEDEFRSWAESFLEKESMSEDLPDLDPLERSDGFLQLMPYYKKMFVVMIIFCFINGAFLAFVWGRSHRYEFVLKRVLGLSRGKIFSDILGNLFLYEALSIGIAGLLTLLYEVLFHNGINIWFRNFISGFGLLALLFGVAGVLLGLISILPASRLRPADVLKPAE